MNSIHDDPAHGWTIQTLAERAGMSRSAFAVKFRQTVGASPMEYLTRWRMLLAGDRVVNSSDPISVISLSLGYGSEAGFSTAFKRVMGCSPRQYSRGHSPAASSPMVQDIAVANQLAFVSVRCSGFDGSGESGSSHIPTASTVAMNVVID